MCSLLFVSPRSPSSKSLRTIKDLLKMNALAKPEVSKGSTFPGGEQLVPIRRHVSRLHEVGHSGVHIATRDSEAGQVKIHQIQRRSCWDRNRIGNCFASSSYSKGRRTGNAFNVRCCIDFLQIRRPQRPAVFLFNTTPMGHCCTSAMNVMPLPATCKFIMT